MLIYFLSALVVVVAVVVSLFYVRKKYKKYLIFYQTILFVFFLSVIIYFVFSISTCCQYRYIACDEPDAIEKVNIYIGDASKKVGAVKEISFSNFGARVCEAKLSNGAIVQYEIPTVEPSFREFILPRAFGRSDFTVNNIRYSENKH